MKGVWLMTLLGLVLVGGCSDHSADPSAPIPIRVSTSVEGSVASRGVVESDAALARVLLLRKDAMTEPTDFSNPMLLVADRTEGTGDLVFDDPQPMYYYTSNSTFLVAYHPQTTVDNQVATWAVDGKTDILVSSVMNAGTYGLPKTGPMIFKHRLAQLAVVCVADPSELVSEEFLQLLWGKITKIELEGTPSELTYTYATNLVGAGGALVTFPLLNKDYETAFEPVAITKNATKAVTAAGMFVPSATTDPLKLKVYTETEPLGKVIEIQLKEGEDPKGFEAGKCHTVTLTFKATGKYIELLATEIEAWKPGYVGEGVLEK